jgi:hypothetical protein
LTSGLLPPCYVPKRCTSLLCSSLCQTFCGNHASQAFVCGRATLWDHMNMWNGQWLESSRHCPIFVKTDRRTDGRTPCLRPPFVVVVLLFHLGTSISRPGHVRPLRSWNQDRHLDGQTDGQTPS